MSGGHFGYKQFEIENIVVELLSLILDNDSDEKDEWGDSVGRQYSAETIEQFMIGLEHLRKAQIYLHRIDWLISGDDDEKSFHERLFEELNGEQDQNG